MECNDNSAMSMDGTGEEQMSSDILDCVEGDENHTSGEVCGEHVEEHGKLVIVEQFCKIALDCSDYNSMKILKNVIEIINNENFDLGVFRSKLPNLDSCIAFGKKQFTEEAARDGFQKNIVQ